MYQIKRRKTFTEELNFSSPNGKELTINVELSLDTQLREFESKYRSIQILNNHVNAGTATYSQLGQGVIDLFEVVFGKVNTQKIITFYTGNYIEMIQDIMPFITDVVKPEFDRQKEESIKKARKTIKDLKR